MFRRALTGVAGISAFFGMTVSGAVHAQANGLVDDARLLAATEDSANWLQFGHDYTNRHFSKLDMINTENVTGLAPAWIFQIGATGVTQTEPLVIDGVMFITTASNDIVALDAGTGAQLWRYRHVPEHQDWSTLPSNRGAAAGYGLIYQATMDGRLIAVDQESGELVWDTRIASIESGLAGKMPPLVYDGKVMIGITGAGGGRVGPDGLGGRGYLSAYDATNGQEIWRWYATQEGWEGDWRETTPVGEPLHRDIAAEQAAFEEHADAWQSGGASTWSSPALDEELGLLYLGTGDPSPVFGDTRPGDNLYANSLVALDIETGETRWHYQQVPHDLWGYDAASQLVLFDLDVDGSSVAAVGHAGKTGWFYVLERATGELIFRSQAFVPQSNIFSPPTEEGALVAPGAAGGASWSPVSLNPETAVVYVAGIHMPFVYQTHDDPDHPAAGSAAPDEPNWGTVTALDLNADGQLKWQHRTERPLTNGVLATAGDLVFFGEPDGHLNGLHAETGEVLWQFQTGGGISAAPIAYEVEGEQYVVVASGQAIVSFKLP